jgi:hypothetical protein
MLFSETDNLNAEVDCVGLMSGINDGSTNGCRNSDLGLSEKYTTCHTYCLEKFWLSFWDISGKTYVIEANIFSKYVFSHFCTCPLL